MDRWIIKPFNLISDRLAAASADLLGHWPNIIAALLVIAAALLVGAMWRSSRRYKRYQIRLEELEHEIDILRRAEERRTLLELKSNEGFLEKFQPDPIDRARSGDLHPVPKIPNY
jgi:hypothetical protein